MPTTEQTINDALAEVLRKTRSAWRSADAIRSEHTRLLKGSAAKPDILVLEANVSPVVIETEVQPAGTVESDAVARLGRQIAESGRKILSTVAVRLPERLRRKSGKALRAELEAADDFQMALYTGSGPEHASRWPHSGWIRGRVVDLSLLTQSASVPPDVVEEAADQLVSGVSEAAGLIEDMAAAHPGAVHKISEHLYQQDGVQTRRMAATILANAFVFHETLAGGPGELASVRAVEQLRGASGGIGKSAILGEWRKILKVNYWPIFDIARRILEVIPAADSRPLINLMAETADKLLANRLMRSHDLTGAVFQRLIADRKFLAAYYTTPASAALLVGLAISADNPLVGRSWGDPNDVAALRIADFACGTGTLLTTAYQRIGQLHELAGGDSEALHPEMMAHALVGCDVLPAAAHLTASMLAGAHPTVKYTQSSILTVAYGRQPDNAVALGSLDLLDPQRKFETLSITAKAAEGMGESEKETWSSLPHTSFDLVIMNPPFTRGTGHEGKKIGIPNPMFAAFSSTKDEQRAMGKAAKQLFASTSAHGNAGEASMFLALAHRKLKPGGVLALVMPLSLMTGDAWEKSRTLLAKNYIDLVLVSIAGVGGAHFSFSADTGMGECLVIGRKTGTASTRATFVVINEPPPFPLLGASAASQVHRLIGGDSLRCLEDGPVGGTPLYFGDEVIGQAMEAPLPVSGGWKLARIADLSLAQTAYQIATEGLVWLPTMNKTDAVEIPITTIASIGKIGPYHADINGSTSTGGIRGPFIVSKIEPRRVPTYPVLWSHDANRERTISFESDCEGIPRKGVTAKEQESVDNKVGTIWATASNCHFNRDFRFNSQSTAMQFTLRKTIGGRAWLSIFMSSVQEEKALVLWGNTTLGLLLHWWHANKQQSGRGSIGRLPLHTLPVLDVKRLTARQLQKASKLFDGMSGRELLPLNEIDRDHTRKELDERFFRDVLSLPEAYLATGGPLELLRMKLAVEPSVRGHKHSDCDCDEDEDEQDS